MSFETIGRYEVRGRLGSGGMATVFKAYDPTFQRIVAVKVLPATLLNAPTFRDRFRREALTIAKLEHTAIVPIYDLGEHEGQPYMVMRLMEGGSLTDKLKNGALSLTHTTRILQRLAPAVDKAHNEGIIHRDIKPDNILFDADDNAYLSDFGIVKLSQETAHLTGTGGIIGTPAYMSPEQARGEGDIGGRSDIYALGAILFEMLTGQLPYTANTPMGVVMKHLTEPVPRILDISPGLPPDVESIITQAMAKEPAARYATATDMVTALEAILSGEALPPTVPSSRPEIHLPSPGSTEVIPPPTGAYDPAATVPSRPSRGRRWIRVAGILLVLGMLAGVGVVQFVIPALMPATATPARVVENATEDDEENENEAEPTDDTADNNGSSLIPLLNGDEDTPTPETATPTMTPAPTDPPTDTPEPVIEPTDTPTTIPPSDTPTPTFTPTPDPISGQIVFDSIRDVPSEIYIMHADGSNPTRLTSNNVQDDEADLSPDGRFIAYESKTGDEWAIMIMGNDGSSPRKITDGRLPDWSPDGRFIAYETEAQQIAIYELATDSIRMLTSSNRNNRAPSWSPDGSQIVLMSQINNVWQLVIYHFNTGQEEPITFDGTHKRFPVWSPDGSLIAYNTLTNSGGPDHIWVISPEGENPTQLTTNGANGRPAWSPDGQYIIYNGNLGGGWLIYRIRRDGSEQTPLTTIGDDQRPDWGAQP